jgi:hypothetical protein
MRGGSVLAALLTFRFDENFNEAAVRKIAQGAQTKFVGMPGLRSKTFSLDAERGEAINFYVWESEEAARAFLTKDLIGRVTELYGVRPSVQFLQVAALVENTPSRNPAAL